MSCLNITSEIGKLKKVLVHRPGQETQRYPHGDFLQAFPLRPACTSFDLEKAQAEHDQLTGILESQDVEVVEVCDLLAQALDSSEDATGRLIEAYLYDSRIEGAELSDAIRRHLDDARTNEQLVRRLFEGIPYGDTDLVESTEFPLSSSTGHTFDPETFLSSPLNTSFFVRDPMNVIGGGVTLNHMYWHDRNREVNLFKTVVECHPDFADTPQWFDHGCSFHLEGGDLLNIDEHTLAVGLSDRTEAAAIDVLCRQLLLHKRDSGITDVYVFLVPQIGNRLHLDTYISRIDYDMFVVDPSIAHNATVYRVRKSPKSDRLRVDSLTDDLNKVFDAMLGMPVQLMQFETASSSRMEAEYSNGAMGMLCLSPRNLCVCEENVLSNNILDKAGMTLHALSIQEMTVGFGGPTSLCLPLCRENI